MATVMKYRYMGYEHCKRPIAQSGYLAKGLGTIPGRMILRSHLVSDLLEELGLRVDPQLHAVIAQI
jgi:hypothetical protein